MPRNLLEIDSELRTMFARRGMQAITSPRGLYRRVLSTNNDREFCNEFVSAAARVASEYHSGRHGDRLEASAECLVAFMCATYSAGVPLADVIDRAGEIVDRIETAPAPPATLE